MIDEGMSSYDIAEHYGVSASGLRGRITELRQRGLLTPIEAPSNAPSDAREASEQKMPPDAKESLDINADGSYASSKPLWMTLEQVKDKDYLLKAHGFEPGAWELVSARNNIWNSYSKQDGIMTLYSSKITVKPKTQSWTFDDLIRAISEKTNPELVELDEDREPVDRMLEIPFYDMHWGVSDFDHYRRTLRDTHELICSKPWRQILFVVGQDLLHNDNFRGTTSSGTPIEVVDMPKAWKEAKRFYSLLIWRALKRCKDVKVMYSKGNHDEAMSWAFVQWIGAKFPQVEIEDSVEERKVHVFGNVFVGVTHGDKARKELINLYPAEFPLEWAQTTYREIHDGHLHREDAMDSYGAMTRTMATRNKTDRWHKNLGFSTAQKRFMLFEYTTEELKHIHYV